MRFHKCHLLQIHCPGITSMLHSYLRTSLRMFGITCDRVHPESRTHCSKPPCDRVHSEPRTHCSKPPCDRVHPESRTHCSKPPCDRVHSESRTCCSKPPCQGYDLRAQNINVLSFTEVRLYTFWNSRRITNHFVVPKESLFHCKLVCKGTNMS